MKWQILVAILAISVVFFPIRETEKDDDDFSILPSEAKEWLNKGKFLDIRGKKIFTIDSRTVNGEISSNDTLLILHGFPTSSLDYQKSLEFLHKRFQRVVLFDFFGFGFSDKPVNYSYSVFEQADATFEVWHQLGIKGGHLLSHDLADSIATEILARRDRKLLPRWFDDFVSVIINNGGMHLEFYSPRISQTLLRTRFGPLVTKLFNFFIFKKQIQSVLGNPSSISDNELIVWWSVINFKNGRERMAKTICYIDDRYKFEPRWTDALTRLNIPTKIIWGRLDTVAPVEIAHKLKSEIPNAKLILLELGHFPMCENPELWSDAVL